MSQTIKLPFVLSTLLYSLLVLSSLVFIVFMSLALHQDQFKFLLEAYSSRSFNITLLSQLYAPLLFIVIYMISIVMMIFSFTYAYYVFYVLNLFLTLMLFINPPIAFLNIVLIISVNLFIFWQFSVYKKSQLDQETTINEE